MVATPVILDLTVKKHAGGVNGDFRRGGCDVPAATATDRHWPLCGGLADGCLASGCPIAAMVKAARDAHKSGLPG